jgi:hypothetical protein
MRVPGTARAQLEKMHSGRMWMWWMYREQEQAQLENEVGRESGVAWEASLGRFSTVLKFAYELFNGN